MKIEETTKLDFSDVLIKPNPSSLSSRKDVNLTRTISFAHCAHVWTGIPIIASNMDTTGTFEMADVLTANNMVTALHKHYSVEELHYYLSTQTETQLRNNIFVSIGIGNSDWEKYLELVKRLDGYYPNLCIDAANGYMDQFVEFCAKARLTIDDRAIIMAGNVVTGNMARTLVQNGVDIVKVGIGPGAMCLTRQVTGIGYPQLSAIMECGRVLSPIGHICSDGGISNPGDMVKALGAPASFVMIGSEFAGHDESGGEEVYEDGNIVGKITYGMSSSTAMKKHYGKVNNYRSSEGRTAVMPYRGSLLSTIQYYQGGLRSAMTYVGAKNLDELGDLITFIKVNHVMNEKYEKETFLKR